MYHFVLNVLHDKKIENSITDINAVVGNCGNWEGLRLARTFAKKLINIMINSIETA